MISISKILDRRVSNGLPAHAARLKTWTRSCLDLAEDAVLSINELACTQPGCDPRQTVILILSSSGPMRKLVFHKALLDVDEADIEEAVRTTSQSGFKASWVS